MTLTATPRRVEVREGGVVIGAETPLTLTFADDDAPRSLELRRRGYEPTTVRVGPDDAPSRTVSLKRRRPKKRRRTRVTAPEPRAPPPREPTTTPPPGAAAPAIPIL